MVHSACGERTGPSTTDFPTNPLIGRAIFSLLDSDTVQASARESSLQQSAREQDCDGLRPRERIKLAARVVDMEPHG